MLGLVDSFSDKWLAFLWGQTVPQYILADLFLYSYENEFFDKLIKEGKRKLARKFNLSYRYIDDLISNKRFKGFISDIYSKNSRFLKPQNLLQLLLISICFSSEIIATI